MADLAGRIHRALYEPVGVDVRIQGLEAATLADGTFDLVVSNVPFGNYQVSDGRNRPYSRFSIHNWFVGKALDLVRPGGLVCLITSAWFLDQRDESARAHAASQADLLSAIRLPQGAFMRLASTDVQSDIVMLRRSQPGESGSAEWVDLDFVPDELRDPRCQDMYMQFNAWYMANPRNVLGLILIQSLQAAMLIDEYIVWTFPVILGRGKRLFEATVKPQALRLVSTKASATGVVMSTHVSAGDIAVGSFAQGGPGD